MKQEFFKVAERRLWNEMVREGEIDRAASRREDAGR